MSMLLCRLCIRCQLIEKCQKKTHFIRIIFHVGIDIEIFLTLFSLPSKTERSNQMRTIWRENEPKTEYILPHQVRHTNEAMRLKSASFHTHPQQYSFYVVFFTEHKSAIFGIFFFAYSLFSSKYKYTWCKIKSYFFSFCRVWKLKEIQWKSEKLFAKNKRITC